MVLLLKIQDDLKRSEAAAPVRLLPNAFDSECRVRYLSRYKRILPSSFPLLGFLKGLTIHRFNDVAPSLREDSPAGERPSMYGYIAISLKARTVSNIYVHALLILNEWSGDFLCRKTWVSVAEGTNPLTLFVRSCSQPTCS